MADKEKKVSFKDTLNLPRTEFPIRANFKENDQKTLERWQAEDLYGVSFAHNADKEKFILHDGPPYANGHIHLGHAYNKILKDIITKTQRMLGKHVPCTPGWDCHGLPIELKVTQEFPELSGPALKKKCREYAKKWVDIQKEEFKALGVLMDWENPYLTMDYGYEASIIEAFGKFVAGGYIERKNKTVPWCASCKTVLATAEIEYEERKDPSIYVEFPLSVEDVEKNFPLLKDKNLSLLIWTTTPWTLPLNRAVVLKPDAEYVVLDVKGKLVIVGKALAEKVSEIIGVPKKIVEEFSSKKLSGLRVQHPFVSGLTVPVLFDQFVAMDEGTACVHSAPGCGPEDYEIALKNNLEIFSPLSVDGKYIEGIEPKELEDMSIADGQIWVLKKLIELDKLLFKTSMRHPYPHCWRCRKGLMFRATKQWFCDLSKDDLKQKALHACHSIEAVPKKSINRLKATIEGRLEWCLSRQRVWGVPIPALLCEDCDTPFIDKSLIDTVSKGVKEHGVEFWDSVTVAQLLPSGFSCQHCSGKKCKKETDILDVWFDSGISHYAVLEKNRNLSFPADMYIEGKDQHRGWFQSSLLTALVLEGVAPMKTLITHGFTVDKTGRKMSKSLGNVVPPEKLIEKLGTDGLRLWASSIDLQGDAVVSDLLVKNVQQVFRKVRNTLRFLLSNMYDYDKKHDAISLEELLPIDRYALEQLCQLSQEVLDLYEAYNFTAVFHRLADYCAVDLSSFYLDIVKDRLYVERPDGLYRRSAQTACAIILDTLTKLIAPIFSFTAEQVSDHYQKEKKESIHLQTFVDLEPMQQQLEKQYTKMDLSDFAPSYIPKQQANKMVETVQYALHQEKTWELLKNIRSAVLKAIELQREQEVLKHSLEARVAVYFDMEQETFEPMKLFYKQLEQGKHDPIKFFKEFLIVSQLEIAPKSDNLDGTDLKGLFVKVQHAEGQKCPRCWQWEETSHEHGLCNRCYEIVK